MNLVRSIKPHAAGAAAITMGWILLMGSPGWGEPGSDPSRPARRAAVVQKAHADRVAARATLPRGSKGMVVAVEPASGTVGPASPGRGLELTARERNGLLRTTAGLTAVRLADGSMMLDLRGRYREFAVVRFDPVAGPRLTCIHDERALRRALDPRAPAPPGFEEE